MSRARPPRPLAAVLLALSLVSGCGSPSGESVKAVFRASLDTDVRAFDPALANDVPTSIVLGGIFQGLMQFHYLARPYKVVPDLAQAHPVVSTDRMTYRFKIRQGVRYHPDPCFGGPGRTREVKARDFVYAFKRLADPKTLSGAWWVLDGWIEGLNAWREAGCDYAREVPGLQAPDDETLVLELTRPYPQLLFILTFAATAPVPEEAVRMYGKDFVLKAIGTGPFMLAENVPGSRIRLVKNPDYREELYPAEGTDWAREHGLLADAGKRLPFLDEVVYEIILEPQAAWLAFLSGKLDRSEIPKDSVVDALDGSGSLRSALAEKGIQLQIWPSQTLWWLTMNTQDPVFQGESGLHLRKAIAYSHDAATFLRVLRSGRGMLINSIIPPGLPSHDPRRITVEYAYDPKKAREELALAGYPGGQGAPRLTMDVRGADPYSRQAAEFVAKGLEEIGLQVDLVGNTYQAFLQKSDKGQVQFGWGRWTGDYPDEENWCQLLYGPNASPGPNYTNYKNPEYDALHEKMRIMEDSEARRDLVHRMMNLAMADCPLRPSFCQTDYVLSQKRLKNLMHGEPIYNHQKYLRVE